MAESDVQRSLGRLEGKLDAFMETQREHERTSAESRKRVYEKLENVETTLNHIDGRVGRAEWVITEIEPLARDFGRVRERSKGVVATIIVAWTLLGGFLMWVGNNVLEWLIARLQGP